MALSPRAMHASTTHVIAAPIVNAECVHFALCTVCVQKRTILIITKVAFFSFKSTAPSKVPNYQNCQLHQARDSGAMFYYVSGEVDGTTHRAINRHDTIGVMVEMTPSEPSTAYMGMGTPVSASCHSQIDVYDNNAEPLPHRGAIEEDHEVARPTSIRVLPTTREPAKMAKLRALEEVEAELESIKFELERNAADLESNETSLVTKDIVESFQKTLDTDVRKSVLYMLLHQDASADLSPVDVDAIEDEKKRLLQHPVMRLIVLLKWRAFGLRGYCEQLFMHLLLLLTFTVSLGLSLKLPTSDIDNQEEFEKGFKKIIYVWLVATPLLVLSLIATRFMTWNNKMLCAGVTLVVGCGAIAGIFVQIDDLLVLCDSMEWFYFNNSLLGHTALYFCIFELRELAADFTSQQHRRDSIMNCVYDLGHFFRSIFNLVRGKTLSPYFESY
ncbi:hypothetical protein ACHHYP_10759, partial [Achlya hypogyna]